MTSPYRPALWLLAAFLLVTTLVYLPGLSGGWILDDYANIVQNQEVQPQSADVPDLVAAALSSPSSRFKRPLASLTFAANYLAGGLNPFGWKLVNLVIHLLNGLLVFVLTKGLIRSLRPEAPHAPMADDTMVGHASTMAALVAGAWLLLPINLTAVLYVVQRMESLANLWVLVGLVGYVACRRRMLAGGRGLAGCLLSLVVPTILGLSAKETAVMLPLYAFLVEWLVFQFRRAEKEGVAGTDKRLHGLFLLVLWLPLAMGLMWVLPSSLRPATWATRDFTLGTRLLSEARIVVDYIGWTVLPVPQWLSFYHDDFVVSRDLLHPWTTLLSILVLIGLLGIVWHQRRRRPLVALGIALYLGCHLLTATILPLELVYEHRNYFASMGILLALVPVLAQSGAQARIRRMLLAVLALTWVGMTAFTAYQWGNPLRLAMELATRAPASPRAQYDLGHTLMIMANFNPRSPYTPLVYAPLERAAALPHASILPEQALLIMNARMGRPQKSEWWQSLTHKLRSHPLGVQDDGALGGMTQCVIGGHCQFDEKHMLDAFEAALSHPRPRASLLAARADYAWNIQKNHHLAYRLMQRTIRAKPKEPQYHITLARMAAVMGKPDVIEEQIQAMRRLNYGNRLDQDISALQALRPIARAHKNTEDNGS